MLYCLSLQSEVPIKNEEETTHAGQSFDKKIERYNISYILVDSDSIVLIKGNYLFNNNSDKVRNNVINSFNIIKYSLNTF